jgi:hypothetical protein
MIAEKIANLDLSSDMVEYCMREACGTFALALYDYLVSQNIDNDLYLLGYDTNWDSLTRPSENNIPYKFPSQLKWDYCNHVVIRDNEQRQFYDVGGQISLIASLRRFDANGVIEVTRKALVSKMGKSDKKPLFFDKEFYKGLVEAFQENKPFLSSSALTL